MTEARQLADKFFAAPLRYSLHPVTSSPARRVRVAGVVGIKFVNQVVPDYKEITNETDSQHRAISYSDGFSFLTRCSTATGARSLVRHLALSYRSLGRRDLPDPSRFDWRCDSVGARRQGACKLGTDHVKAGRRHRIPLGR